MDPQHEASVRGVRAHFDAVAHGEWERLDKDLPGRVSFEVHRRFLARFVTPGMRVLEVGAGPGRFTRELLALGARVVVTDLSAVQLALNAEYAGVAGVEARQLADVCDLSEFADASFDAALAYGGPLSYVFDEAPTAMAEMLRVVRPGGHVVASVMSTLGAYRYLLPGVLDVIEQFGDDANDRVIATGDLREVQPPDEGHSCRMYRWSGVQALVAESGAELVAASASNWASLGDLEALERLAADPGHWARFVDNEVRFCAEPGALDGGTHLLFTARRG